MMKIGFLIPYFYPQTGGAENNCYFLARELAKKHEVHVFCSGVINSEEVIEGIKVHRFKEVFRASYYFAFYPGITKPVVNAGLDILHVHGFGFSQQDMVVANIKRYSAETKIVCTPHGPFMALKSYNLLGKIFKSIYFSRVLKSLKEHDIIIEVNPYQETWLEKEYKVPPKKIVLLPNGIPRDFSKGLPRSLVTRASNKYKLSGRKVISYVGRIQKYKGLDQIISVLPDLVKIDSSIVFVAIGRDDNQTSQLKDLANKLGVKEHLIFTGEISENDKKAILGISEIFVFPSEWEAFGIAMLEAMAKGNAIVSTDTEGGRYLITPGKNGFLFRKGDLKSLTSRLSLLLKDKELREKMQRTNIDISKKFIWSDIAKDLETLYKRLTHENTRVN